MSSTEAEVISAVTAANTSRLLRSMIREPGFPKEYNTPIDEENNPIIDIVNSSISTEITCHVDVRFFSILGWKEAGDIIMHNIPGIINPADGLPKPLGWVLHYINDRYLMGHYNISLGYSRNA